MEIAYVAHSARMALLLDGEGVCVCFVTKADDEASIASAKRCVGARFLASLDPEAPGMLAHEPRVGKNLLFARVDDGRVALVRFGPLLRLDRLNEEDEKAPSAEEARAPRDAKKPEEGAVTLRAPTADPPPAPVSDTTLQRPAPASDTTLQRPAPRATLEDFDDIPTEVAESRRSSGVMSSKLEPEARPTIEELDPETRRFRRDSSPSEPAVRPSRTGYRIVRRGA